MSAVFKRLDPMTGAVASTSPAMTITDATAVADTAAAAFPAWSALGPTTRRAALNHAADKLEARVADFVAAMQAESGATEGWARFYLTLAAGMLREAAALIAEAPGETGLPVGLVTNAPADAAKVVGALIDHPAVRRINFTGSIAVGRIIAHRAAEHLKPCLLEAGGKAPLIILDDATARRCTTSPRCRSVAWVRRTMAGSVAASG